MKQLFFRLNQQQFRNKKYKHKDNSGPKPADNRGCSVQTAIDVDAIEDHHATSAISRQSDNTTFNESPPASVSVKAEAPHFDQLQSARYVSPDRPDRVILDDIYAVPPSPPVGFLPPMVCLSDF